MPSYLTVKEAATYIGRSTSAVRRIIRPIFKDDQHPDRHHLQPSVEEVRELRLKGETFLWRVNQELLDRRIIANPTTESSAAPAPAFQRSDPLLRELVTMLRDQVQQTQEQLKVKDQQIASLTEITNNLNERLREGNILIGSLQRQLALPMGEQRSVKTTSNASNRASKHTTKSSSNSQSLNSPKVASKKPAKKGFFARLFA